MPLQIVTIPCLEDNYAFLLHDPDSGQTALVDAPESAPIETLLKSKGWGLDMILITHHHWDHVEGLKDLRTTYKPRVYGAKADAHRLPALDVELTQGDTVSIGDNHGTVMDVSGHCANHLAFHFPQSRAVFTSDSLMALGCGRVFEGTMNQMWDSLSKLAALPPQTIVYSGHEYTATNAAFAYTIEPENAALKDRILQVIEARDRGIATVPSILQDELATNPFLRAASPEIRARLGLETASDAEVFGEIRRRKDRFSFTGMPDLSR